MKKVDVREVNKEDLVDLQTVIIEDRLSQKARIRSFVTQIGNPYCYRVGSIVVKSTFCDDGCTFQERFQELLSLM